MIPGVAAGGHVAFNLVADSVDHDHGGNGRAGFQCFVSGRFLGNSLVAAEGSVADHQHFGAAVDDSVTECVSAESAENDAVNGADAGAGQSGNAQFGNHRHIQTDAVALLNALGFQNVGEFADFFMQLFVGNGSFFARLVAFPLNRNLIAAFLKVPVQAVVRNIEFAAFKKLHIDGAFFNVKVVIHHFVPFFEPGHLLLGDFRPELFRFFDRFFPQLVVSISSANPGFLFRLFRNRIYLL